MSFFNLLKNWYYSVEDKWYLILDKIDSKIPIYKIIDPIDKVIPSFVLFLLLFFFIIILIIYFIRFSSPYDITFTINDASTNIGISGVLISGNINNTDFKEVITSISGKATIKTKGPKNNLYDIINSMFFESEFVSIGEISAEKEGYVKIKEKSLTISGNSHSLLLNKIPKESAKFSGIANITLIDSETLLKIFDTTGNSKIKYECRNIRLPNSPIIVEDDDDGSMDGFFSLIQENCEFVIVEASSPNYESLGSQIVLDSTKESHQIELTKQALDEGVATVFVYDLNGTNKRALPGIKVIFNKGAFSDYSITNNSGFAEKTLESGEYIITITDENYYPITLENNKKINIIKGANEPIEIQLTYMPEADRRMVYFRVIDSNNNPITNATITLIELQKDSNGNIYGTDQLNNNSFFTPLISNTTDQNGLFKQPSFSNTSENILAIVEKDSYLTKMFLPKLVKYSDTYEDIKLEKLVLSETSKAIVIVKNKDNNKSIFGATAFLYYTTSINGITIQNIPIIKSGKITDASGKAEYSNLLPGLYSAGAEWRGEYFSKITESKNIDANKERDFNVYINFNASNLSFRLIDAVTKTPIVGLIEIYRQSNSTRFLIETVSTNTTSYVKSNFEFSNNEELYFIAKATNYTNSFVYQNGIESPLKKGNNFFTIRVYPRSELYVDNGNNNKKNTYTIDGNRICLNSNITDCFNIINPDELLYSEIKIKSESGSTSVCTTQSDYSIICSHNNTRYYYSARVNAFFNNIYSKSDNPVLGISTVDSILSGEEYSAVFDLVIDGNVTYTEVLSRIRFEGPGKITNVLIDFPPRVGQKGHNCTQDINQENIIRTRTNEFYYPSNNCSVSETKEFEIAGYKWQSENIPKGTYSFKINFKVDKDSTGKQIRLYYRAKKVDNLGESESLLSNNGFIVGEILGSGVYFKVENNGNILTIKESATISSNNKIILSEDKSNLLKISLINNKENQTISNATLTIYSYNGSLTAFNETTTGSGDLFFGTNKTKTMVLGNNINLNYKESRDFSVETFISKNTSSWMVLVLKSGSTIISKVFIRAASIGDTIELKDYCFMAGIKGQNSYLRFGPTRGLGTLISNAKITVYKNCSIPFLREKSEEKFIQSIDGMISFKLDENKTYSSKDCLEYRFDSIEGSYVYPTLNGLVYAGSCGTPDPEVACLNMELIHNNQNETLDTIQMEWNKTATLKVTNRTCANDMVVVIDSGLVCSIDEKNCDNATLVSKGDTKNFIITSKNIGYDSTMYPNFSDVLGYYPIYVKAKPSNNLRKTYAVAKKLSVSIFNPNTCFALSKDYFDFTTTQQPIPFVLNNTCQYTLIGDYFVPKLTIDSFGYDINLVNKIKINQVTFRPKVVIEGQSYVTNYIDQNFWYWYEGTLDDTILINETTENDGSYKKYQTYKFDFNKNSGVVDKVRIYFMDYNYDLIKIETEEGINPRVISGVSIDGPIKINYKDGTSQLISMNKNFSIIDNPPQCVTNGTGSVSECFVYNAYYDPTRNTRTLQDRNYISGYLTINIAPAKEIKDIDLNLIGGPISGNLQVRIESNNRLVERIPHYTPTGKFSKVEIPLYSTYSTINAIEGIEYIIKKLSDITVFNNSYFDSLHNPTVYIDSNNTNVLVWIDGNLVKAKYIGKDNRSNYPQKINAELIKSTGHGNITGIIEVIDYVFTYPGKIISGVNQKQ